MDFLKIIIAAFSATNLMTTFSYLISDHYNKLFKEPVLLNYIFQKFDAFPKGKWTVACAWLTHYIVGLIFVLLYAFLWKYSEIPFGWVSGIGFGIASGILGVFSWMLIFKLPDGRPNVNEREYYIQLFFARIIFAIAVVVAFKLYDFDPIAHAAKAFQ